MGAPDMAWLEANQGHGPKPALRFLTAGSVDDGKSTLIGRLLYDSQALWVDQVDTLRARAAGTQAAGTADGAGGPAFDLSLLTDGLEAEREQGITIDVAYRYFRTAARKFVIADAPGHEQYTRNMVTAAAGSDAVVVLVDLTKLAAAGATAGAGPRAVELLPQTRRHALLAQLLRVPSIVFAVNKIDAVEAPREAFEAARTALLDFAAEAGFTPAAVVPVSALRGDNVATPLRNDWYHGPSLLQVLESLPTLAAADATAAHGDESGDDANAGGHAAPAFGLAVQYVTRNAASSGGAGARTFWGRVAQGRIALGDTVEVFPSGERARVASLSNAAGPAASVDAGTSAGVVLDRALDVSRGDWLGAPGGFLPVQRFAATLAWLDTEPAAPGRHYLLRHGHRWVQARLLSIAHRLDVQTLRREAAETLAVNEIGEVEFELRQSLPLRPFADDRNAGALIVVDPASHRTSGALLVREPRGEEAEARR